MMTLTNFINMQYHNFSVSCCVLHFSGGISRSEGTAATVVHFVTYINVFAVLLITVT